MPAMSPEELRHLCRAAWGNAWRQRLLEAMAPRDRSTLWRWQQYGVRQRDTADMIRLRCHQALTADREPEPLRPQVLIVEDEWWISVAAERVMQDMGLSAVLAPTLEAGLAIAEGAPLAAAAVDLRLGRQLATPVIACLIRRRVPIVIATGFTDQLGLLPLHMRGLPIVEKPYSADALAGAVGGLIDRDAA